MKKSLILVSVLIILLISCSNNNKSEKFIGTWKSIEVQNDYYRNLYKIVLTINKVGENFTVQRHSELIKTIYKTSIPFVSDEKIIFSYNKEQDKLESSNGRRPSTIILDPTTGHILVDGDVYEKVK